MKHYARPGDKFAVCSTSTDRVTAPLTTNKWFATCPRCAAIIATPPKPRTAPRAKITGLPTSDSAAITQARIALGLKKKAAPKKPKAPAVQIDGQTDVFDFVDTFKVGSDSPRDEEGQ